MVPSGRPDGMLAAMRFRRHLFVCTHSRDGLGGKPSCAERGSPAFIAAVERGLAARWKEGAAAVAVTPCGCLGPCFDGPTAVVYPDGSWYAGLRVADAEAMVSHLLGGPAPRAYDWSDDGDD